jgi:hypothetical protein
MVLSYHFILDMTSFLIVFFILVRSRTANICWFHLLITPICEAVRPTPH